MPETVSVIVSGKTVEGVSIEQASKNLAALFKLTDDRVAALFTGKPVAIKRGLDQARAVKLCAALAKAGVVGQIRPEQSAATGLPKQVSAEPPAGQQTPVGAVATGASSSDLAPDARSEARGEDRLSCPRCGHEQAVSQQCSHCGMDLRLHLRRMERKRLIRAFQQRQS